MTFPFVRKRNEEDTLPKECAEYLAPSREFIKTSEHVFLSAYDAQYPAHTPLWTGRIMFAVRFAILFVLLSGALGGTAFYADAQDVGPTHPLYQMKRYSENVRLALTPQDDQEKLHLAFARRRFGEIQAAKKASVKSTEVVLLQNDFDKELNSLAPEVRDEEGDSAQVAEVPQAAATLENTSSVEMQRNAKDAHTAPMSISLQAMPPSSTTSTATSSSNKVPHPKLKLTSMEVCLFIREASDKDPETLADALRSDPKLAKRIETRCERIEEQMEKKNQRTLQGNVSSSLSVLTTTTTPTSTKKKVLRSR